LTSDLQLWIIAAACFCACSVAFATMPLAKPGTKQRLGRRARVAVAPLPPLAGAAFVTVSCLRRDASVVTGLQLFIVAMAVLVLMRVVFAGWVKRAAEKYYGDATAVSTDSPKEG
jgi:hypothetical protein